MSAACSVCDSPPVLPCVRCQSTLSHRHLAMLDRDGQMLSQVPLCRACAGTIRIRQQPLSKLLVDVEAGVS